MTLHPRLEADCHVLGRVEEATLLLHKSASVPWLIVVPDGELSDVDDLDEKERARVMSLWHRVALNLKQATGCRRINMASIGNLVPQLHLHVIARSEEDPFWPGTVWGQDLGEKTWSESDVEDWKHRLLSS